MTKLVFIKSLKTLTLHDGNHVEFPMPNPLFFQGPAKLAKELPEGNFEVPLAAEEGKEQQILKGTASEIVISLTKGYNADCLTKEGKLDGGLYQKRLARIQGILAGGATKTEAETNEILTMAALITTTERALNPELDETITAIEDAGEDVNPYTVTIEAITDILLADDVASPEAAPTEVKAEAETAPEPAVAETTPAVEEPANANLPVVPGAVPTNAIAAMGLNELKGQLTNLATANRATITTNAKIIAAQSALNEALAANNVTLEAQQAQLTNFQTMLETATAPALPEVASK